MVLTPERARQLAKKRAAVRPAKAQQRRRAADPVLSLADRWPEPPDIIEFVTHPDLLGLEVSPAQETLLRASYGLPLTAEQLDLWHRCTGRDKYSGQPLPEVTAMACVRPPSATSRLEGVGGSS